MVGTFYRASAPEAPPFVNEGDVIKEGQVLCIIEAMKLMNEIEAKAAGRVAKILVENAQPVEFGQTLFLVEPRADGPGPVTAACPARPAPSTHSLERALQARTRLGGHVSRGRAGQAAAPPVNADQGRYRV